MDNRCKTTDVVGVILAGGRGRRLGGRDKAFVTLQGTPLLTHILARLQPQVDRVAISSNGAPARFAPWGLPVVRDARPGLLGPLAGIHAALLTWPDAFIVSVAVDLPFLPRDLVARLREGLGHAACAYASDGTHHALAALWRPGQASTLGAYLDEGRQSLMGYLERYGREIVFAADADSDVGFNINTPDDLARAQARLDALHPQPP